MKTPEEIKFHLDIYNECLKHFKNDTLNQASPGIKYLSLIHTEESLLERIKQLEQQLNDHHSS